MNILLVRPRQSSETIGLQHIIICEPLELEVLAATIPVSDTVTIIDMILEKKDFLFHLTHLKPDVVCVTGYITNIPQMIHYCKEAKAFNPGIVTVAGGVHVEKLPEDINHEVVDFRVVRNATRSFPQLLDFLKGNGAFPKGVLRHNDTRNEDELPEFDFYYPHPRRELVKHYMKNYFYIFHDKVSLLKTSFGCPYKCNFCYCIEITNHKYHVRDLEDVLDELETIESKEIYIVDDDFIVSPSRTRDFIAGLKQRNIRKKYLIFGRADFIVKHPDVIAEFGEVGLGSVIVGFESFNNEELASLNKEISANVNEQAMSILNALDIDCYASVIVSPDWNEADFDSFVVKSKQLGIEYVVLQPLTPFPGTGFIVDPDDLLIDRKDFPKWDLAHVSIRPKKMSLPEFYKHLLKSYRKIAFSPKTILRHTKYPLHMQWRVLSGLIKIHKQYMKRYRQALRNV